MITEHDLREAIAECEGAKNPTANTCLKLAAFYTIRDKMYPAQNEPQETPVFPAYSYAERPVYTSDTEFMHIAENKPINELLAVLDEVMTAVSVLNPRLYAAAIRKLSE